MDDILLVPPLARDARCRVLAELIRRIGAVDLTPVLVYLIDAVNSSVLPYLAEQLHVLDEGWADARDDASRRKLLKRAIELHRHKGTRWAVETALDVLGLGCRVEEWFEYGGEPGRFRVDLISSTPLSEDFYVQGIERAIELITKSKNVRSHLEAIRIVLAVVSQVPVIGAAMLGGETVTILPFIQTDIERVDAVPRFGAGIQSLETVTLYPAS
jgi:phage tail P2-like protein